MKVRSANIYSLLVMIFIAFISFTFYLAPATSIARGSGTVLSDNWWEALNWIEQNTPECAAVATYWDPGHFITAIAKRPIVFGGASQNAQFETRVEGTPTQGELAKLGPTGKYTTRTEAVNGTEYTVVSTARIQDIGTALFTPNETLAYEILKRYNKPGCGEMYFVASADLIGKAHWWTYFATWNPVDKGTPYNYLMLNLGGARPVAEQNAVAYIYPVGQDQSFVLLDRNGTIVPYLQQGGQLASVDKIFYVKNGAPVLEESADAQIGGLLWLDQSRQLVVFISPELEDSMFTRMFFFNGAGLEKFQFVNNWGGEFKLFRLDMTDQR